ncbi:MAG: hypothetical protein ABWY07_03005, partial [Burkholderiales bacterium]
AIIEDGQFNMRPDVYIRDFVGDTGDPYAGAISASPDVILVPTTVADAQAAFGEGSGTENLNNLGHEATAGQDNYVYVRAKNRGGSDGPGTSAQVFWSPPSTLVTPDLWQPVGTQAMPNLPTGDTLVAAGPITWAEADIPAPGHYCFVAILSQSHDPGPDPIDFLDWDNFRAFIRNNNNVTWRNFNVDSNAPDEGSEFKSLRFLAPGFDDMARRFCLEVIAKLPRGSKCLLEAPLPLLQAMQALSPGAIVEGGVGRIPVNPHRPHRIGCALFPAKHAFPLRLLVHIPEPHRGHAYNVAVRQLYEGEEVGRVTWRLAPEAD